MSEMLEQNMETGNIRKDRQGRKMEMSERSEWNRMETENVGKSMETERWKNVGKSERMGQRHGDGIFESDGTNAQKRKMHRNIGVFRVGM